jgi:hypothetical protein
VPELDWAGWHDAYDNPESHLSRRLELVQGHLRDALDRAPTGDIRLISMCAGQGRDVIGVLATHPRTGDVDARLVELDERNVDFARRSASEANLDKVDIVCGDAGMTDSYAGAVPAHVVLACGIFGNVSDDSIAKTVAALPVLCEAGAVVIPSIRRWFDEAGFEELAFDAPEDVFPIAVGVHCLVAEPRPLGNTQRLFTFSDEASDVHLRLK